MPKTRVYAPADVIPDKIINVPIPRGCTYFEFHNESRYHILLRNDAGAPSPSKVFDPVDVVLPYSSTSTQIEPEDIEISYVAAGPSTGGYSIASPLPEDENSFWFIASEYPRSAPAFRGVGIQGQLINITRDSTQPFISARLEGDLFDRLQMFADGRFKIGLGDLAPARIWEIGGPGELLFREPPSLNPPVGDVIPDFVDWEFITANWVLQQIALGEFTPEMAINSRGANAGPTTYPLGYSTMRRDDGLGGWPGSSTGMVSTVRTAGAAYTLQFFIDTSDNSLRWRTGAVGDAWNGWNQAADRGWVNSLGFVTQAAIDAVINTTNATPGVGGAYTVNQLVRLRRTGNSIAVEGQITNNGGAAIAAGATIFSVPVAMRPGAAVVFPCARFIAGAWQGDQLLPVQVQAGGNVNHLTTFPAGNTIDLGSLGWNVP